MGKWTRRAFISAGVVAGGALLVGVSIRPGKRHQGMAGLVAEDGETLVNAYVKIDVDNHVTAIIPHSEMGQGAQTALTQMLADELDAEWSSVSFMEAPAEDDYANWALGKGYLAGDADVPESLVPSLDGAFMAIASAMHMQITGGSLSVRTTGVTGMRVAGAAAREMLVAAAAAAWGVPSSEITTRNSHLIHEASGRDATYAEFAAAAGEMTPPRSPALKTPDQFRLMGKSVARRDIPSKVDGTAAFGIDADVPGMKYAAIIGAPVFGAEVASVDAAAAEAMAGVDQIVTLENAVAVVADGYWKASQALSKVKVQWTSTPNDGLDSDAIFAQFDRDLDAARAGGESTADVEQGDVAGAFSGADQIVEATYRVPWLAHTCMEPMNATARVEDGTCEIWVGSQNPLGYRYEIAAALEMEVENVVLHQHFMGGGFGRRATPDTAIQAARIAREIGAPVKLIWSREEDVRHDLYRPAVMSKFRAALDPNGAVRGWENVYHEKHEPVEAPTIPYAVAAQHIHHTASPTHVPFGAWRSVDHSQHGFFTESFIDEVAVAAGRDPYEYRRELLADDPRSLAVLDMAAEKAGWGERLGPNQGRGIAIQSSFGSIVAQVVDVTVTDGNLSVDRVVCVADCGFAVSPNGLTAQMESGTNYGLTAALFGNIEIENGAVKQSNFHDYEAVRMDISPRVETYILNSGEAWGGAGEPGTPGIAPALANAVFQATGLRIRELPLKLHDLRSPVETDEVELTG